MSVTLPHALTSEIGVRLRALDPNIGVVLDMPEVTLPGEQLEKLLVASFMLGLGAAADDDILAVAEIALGDR